MEAGILEAERGDSPFRSFSRQNFRQIISRRIIWARSPWKIANSCTQGYRGRTSGPSSGCIHEAATPGRQVSWEGPEIGRLGRRGTREETDSTIRAGPVKQQSSFSLRQVSCEHSDVDMMVRSMRSDWLQKARLLPRDDFCLGDSGAQISVTNIATAAKFGLQQHTYDTPIRIRLG